LPSQLSREVLRLPAIAAGDHHANAAARQFAGYMRAKRSIAAEYYCRDHEAAGYSSRRFCSRSRAVSHFSGVSYVPSTISRRTRSTSSQRTSVSERGGGPSSGSATAVAPQLSSLTKEAHHSRLRVTGPFRQLGPWL